ncbi:acetate--CoA ligase [Candidatus Woesearchaeota archaeon]|nr:acetate--CoA ligase [Candidatus Woesearchaeota archaeon]
MTDSASSGRKSAKKVYYPSNHFSQRACIKSFSEYQKLYSSSIRNPEKFWKAQASILNWFKPFTAVFQQKKKPFCKWFAGGKLNASYNCIDRHIALRGDKKAIIWQGEPEEDVKVLTYTELLQEVCKFAHVLRKFGVRKGDRVCIYLPMIPEIAISMLACARIGAIHAVVFGGFSAQALAKRINDSGAKLLVTADGSFRRGKIVELKEAADEALLQCKHVKRVVVVKRAGNKIRMKRGRDVWWHQEMEKKGVGNFIEPILMDAEDTLFLLYTSGTTGMPKGMEHTTGGYLVYAALTMKYIFDLREEDVYFCTADIGWITGHSYIVYGPLCNGATVVMYEGAPDAPDPGRFWKIVEKFKVSIFYTAPTVIRALAKEGEQWPRGHELSSLRLLGTVGEPINPESWRWYFNNIGKGKCPIVDTWWQTETGGILISPLPGAVPLKPGSATVPFFGIEPEILREDGKKAKAGEGGYLAIKKPWPGIARTIWKNPKRYVETYFSKFNGKYLTGDGAMVDEDGYYWITGRIDDVIKVSGHRIGTAEVESALVSYPGVAEAAVVPVPHPIKGEAIYAFVVLKKGKIGDDELKLKLIEHVKKEIGAIAKPEAIQFAEGLPKTRSGKIMRRVLKAIASGSAEVGDVSTMADAGVVEELKNGASFVQG